MITPNLHKSWLEVSGQVSQADKLFEELGYEKEIHTKSEPLHNWESITYSTENMFIEFNGYHGAIIIGNEDNKEDIVLSIQELKTINKKCEELGWEV